MEIGQGIAIGLATAGLVALIAWLWRAAQTRRRSAAAQRQIKIDDGRASERIVDWYRKNGLESNLYRASQFTNSPVLPVLSSDSLIFCQRLDLATSWLLLVEPQDQPDQLPVDQKVVERRRAQGTRLVDNPIVYMRSFEDEGPTLHCRHAGYFAYATAVDRMERDLLAARPGRMRLLKQRFPSTAVALSGEHPLWLSGNATTVFDVNDQLLVPIQVRSGNVINGQGKRTVLPVFGIEPTETTGLRSAFPPLLHNVAREFGEELFGVEEVEDVQAQRRANPDWICDHEPIRALLDSVGSGQVEIYATGLAINPRDENLAISLLIWVRCDEEWFDRLEECRANWEGEAGAALQFTDLWDPALDTYVNDRAVFPTSAFSLDRARHFFSSK